jgi:DDE superfamily endonuclease/Helix-turn-helix of DDE superfamily endonuclease
LHAKPMTGLSPEQLDLLCDRVADQVGTWQPPRGRHRTLELAAAITMTLTWLRHNLSQALLGCFYGISQASVSRIITRLREPIAQATQGMPGLAETRPGERLLLDGSLLPTGQRAGQAGVGLYSGKRHKAGMNVLVIGDRWGRLVEVSDPTPGSMHDARSFAVCGLDRALAERSVLADLGFLGCGVATPLRKPPGGKLCELEKANNRAHASVRAAVERTIALLKQWKVLGSGYRGPLARFPGVVRTVVALEKFRIYENPF